MDYCTIEDIETHVSTSTLIQLTSDYEQDEVDRVVAEEAIIYSSKTAPLATRLRPSRSTTG